MNEIQYCKTSCTLQSVALLLLQSVTPPSYSIFEKMVRDCFIGWFHGGVICWFVYSLFHFTFSSCIAGFVGLFFDLFIGLFIYLDYVSLQEKMKGKNKLVPRLLGVTKESILRVDEKTKEVGTHIIKRCYIVN